jgi:glycerol-3-phosphate dehydrogenase
MRAAVIGGGINGVMTAWALKARGWEVTLFEQSTVMSGTSSASTKLLHGGLRYLERGDFRLVRESLRERAWWLSQAPHLCCPIELILPIRLIGGRPSWKVRLGLALYRALAGRSALGRHRWRSPYELAEAVPGLRIAEFSGGFSFWDGQMDDHALGLWAASRAAEAGVSMRENCRVEEVSTAGHVRTAGGVERFGAVVNVAGPWASELLNRSGISSDCRLDLVRGSHLVLDRPCRQGLLAEIPGGSRVGFVLPWKSRTLVGTTEVRQTAADGPCCSDDERDYLIAFYNSLFERPVSSGDVLESFAGVRPLVARNRDPTAQSREYAIERQGVLWTVFGGKWTTARALGERVGRLVDRG